MPADYVDSDSVIAVAEAAGGAALRQRHEDISVNLEGGYARSYQYDYPEHVSKAIWVVRYLADSGGLLTVLIDALTGELQEVDLVKQRDPATAGAAEPDALALASEGVADSAALQLFRIWGQLYAPIDGLATHWEFSYLHPALGRVNVMLGEFYSETTLDPGYRHPPSAPVVPH